MPVRPPAAAAAAEAAEGLVQGRGCLGQDRRSRRQQDTAEALYQLNRIPDCSSARRTLGLLAAACRNTVGAWCAEDMSKALFGLRQQGTSAEADAVQLAMAGVMRHVSHLDSVAVAHALYGTQLCGTSPAGEELLAVLAPLAARCPDPLKPAAAALALFGLKRRRSGADVESLLFTIVRMLQRSSGKLEPHEVAMALYGLQGMVPSIGVTAVLRAVHGRMGEGRPSAKQLGMALYGLQQQQGGDVVEEVLLDLAMMMPRCTEPLQGHLGTALYGMKHLPQSQATEAVLLQIAASAARSRGPLAPGQVAAALFGLQRQWPSPGADAVLHALPPLIRGASALSPAEVAMSLYGLRRLWRSSAAEAVLAELTALMQGCSGPLSGDGVAQSTSELRQLPHSAARERALVELARLMQGCEQLTALQAELILSELVHAVPSRGLDRVLCALAPLLRRVKGTLRARAVEGAWRRLEGTSLRDLQGAVLVLAELERLAPQAAAEHPG
eukprot:TRINITY_DN65365_c0_g1_i1.p1 TRINITY_DN65365_c0_g1~~TRINITY_DN65365_c0_g1_i1.p1  ORF type:complete len:524 (+),score=116.41 TRINITY_DN65365_c0_g1_i1:78-1574(+)